MTRPWLAALLFGLCLAVVLAAMGWTSLTVIRLDHAEEQARRQSELEENVRLALWRMDSALAPLIAQETARPYFSYGAFYPSERAYTRMFNDVQNGELLSPSPLLNETVPHTLLHFQFSPEGKATSPQVPTGNKVDLARQFCRTTDVVQASAERLCEFEKHVTRESLLEALHDDVVVNPPVIPQMEQPPMQQQGEAQGIDGYGNSQFKQIQRSSAELQQRAKASQELGEMWANYSPGSRINRNTHVTEGLIKPIWVNDNLVLARRVVVDSHIYVQGCWLDWKDIQSWLVSNVKDLLPAAKLQPLKSASDERGLYRLASLPVVLVPGTIAVEPDPFLSPVRLSLFVAWICVVLAAAAVAMLLLGAVTLSERRGAFVSAVTHELRTPLTTFRMYTEMLAGDMVPDEEKRKQYLNTLRLEAERLSHLVENVLSYARLERTARNQRTEPVDIPQLMRQVKDRMNERAQQFGMELRLVVTEEVVRAQADSSAVEQILVNLVDNACKYGAPPAIAGLAAKTGVIELSAANVGKGIQLCVCDNGRGISKIEARKLFRPFSKSAKDAASSAPGVGLGLALSRRLAREMGGDLYLDHDVDQGACFVLSLPAFERE